MNYGNIKFNDIANGEGIRVTLFVSGCTHHCKHCFNPETWNFNYGKEFNSEVEKQIIESLEPDYINGLTLLGGEPFEVENQRVLFPFVKKVKEKYPNKTIWAYSGYTYEQLTQEGAPNCEVTKELLSLIDVLVDGEFVENLKNLKLKFRGSSNQRIIDVQETIKKGQIVLNKLNSVD